MASREISDLHPALQLIASRHLTQANYELAKIGCSCFITCTYRSDKDQEELYAIGRTKDLTKRRVTNAKPGQSAHNFTISGKPASIAYDMAISVNGKINWESSHPAWQIVGRVGEGLGLIWAYRWIRFKESPHFQLRGIDPSSRT